MLRKKKKLMMELTMITIIWLIALNLGEIMATIASLMFIMTYIMIMIDALREKKPKAKPTISPALTLKRPV